MLRIYIQSIAAVIFFHLSFLSLAQVSKGGIPFTFTQNFVGAKSGIPKIIMPEVNNTVLQQEDTDNPENSRYGIIHNVNIGLNTDGKWDTMPNGDKVWRLKITSATAYSIQLYYDQFYLKSGAEFFIYNEPVTMTIGAFTSANNKTSGLFATQPVIGESVILELYEPFGTDGVSSILHINQVGHAYINLFGPTVETAGDDDCLIDVACPEGNDWGNQIRSVVLLLKKDQNNNLTYASGAMINNINNDGKPYLLTAFHTLDVDLDCDIDATEMTNLEQWIFRFNYQLPQCSTGTAPTDQTVTGAELRAQSLAPDMALIELSEMPKQNYNVFLAGWNNSSSDVFISGVGIHHPWAKPKKISITNTTLVTGTKGGGTCAQNENVYWHVKFKVDNGNGGTDGIIMNGSSGSPFFNVFGQIIGQLSRGDRQNCTLAVQPDLTYYGKFSESWITSADLANYLSPNSSNVTTLSGINLNDIPAINTCNDQTCNGDEECMTNPGQIADCGGSFCAPCSSNPPPPPPPGDCNIDLIDMSINGYETGEPCISLPIVLKPFGNCNNPKWWNWAYIEPSGLCTNVHKWFITRADFYENDPNPVVDPDEECINVPNPTASLCSTGSLGISCDCKYFAYDIAIAEVDPNTHQWIGNLYTQCFTMQINSNESSTMPYETVTIGQNEINEIGISLVPGKMYGIAIQAPYTGTTAKVFLRYFRVNLQDIAYNNTNLVSSNPFLNNIITNSTLAANAVGNNITLNNITTTNYITSTNNIHLTATNSISITNSIITPGFVAQIDDIACSQQRLANPNDENDDGTKNKPAAMVKSINYETKTKPSDEKYVFENLKNKNEATKNQEDVSPITLIPNPSASGVFNIVGGTESRLQSVTVVNLLGAVVFLSEHLTPDSQLIDISNQPKGIYFVKIQSGEEFSVHKVVYQ